MPEFLRAYIVVIFLSAFALFIVNRWKPFPVSAPEYRSWIVLWLGMTSVAFLGFNYWIFILLGAVLLSRVLPRNLEDKVAAYFFLLPTLPFLTRQIPGFGGINFLFDMTYPRLLDFVVLVPVFFALIGGTRGRAATRYFPSDKYAYSYFVLISILAFRDTTITGGIRGAFYVLTDQFLPYYVVSRAVISLDGFRKVFSAIAASAFVVSVLAIFEAGKQWYLFENLERTLSQYRGRSSPYAVGRFGSIRVKTTFAGPIALGYFLVIGYAALRFLKTYFKDNKVYFGFSMAILVSLILTFSRGPWVGLVIFLCVFAILSPRRGKALPSLALVGAGIAFVLITIPGGDKIIGFLPYLGGGAATGSVDYRERLFTNSLIVISRSPFLGSTTYMSAPEMLELRTGQGIIDTVNTYLVIALTAGYIGLGLFAGTFISVLLGILKNTRRAHTLGIEYFTVGQTLFSVVFAMLVIVGTVSPIGSIPLYYWSFAGLGAAYINLMRANTGEKNRTKTLEQDRHFSHVQG